MTFTEKCKILDDFWMTQHDESWNDFISWHQDALLDAGFYLYDGLGVDPTGVNEAFFDLCSELLIDPDRNYSSLDEMYEMSPNPVV